MAKKLIKTYQIVTSKPVEKNGEVSYLIQVWEITPKKITKAIIQDELAKVIADKQKTKIAHIY